MDNGILQELAIIILNYRNYEMTIECVSNLKRIGIDCKIIVVDNNSPNDSYDKLMRKLSSLKNVYLIKTEKNGGYSYGNNEGIRFATNKFNNINYICIMNPDVFLHTKAILIKICNKLSINNDIAGLTGVTLLNGKLNYNTIGWRVNNVKNLILSNFSLLSKMLRISTSYRELNMKVDDYEIGYMDVMPGSFFIMKNSVFKEINYLDENVFLYFEEEILARKIKSKGLKSGLLISESYTHKHVGKDNELENIKKKKLDFRIYMASQIYYVKNFISNSAVISSILKTSQYIHLYIEIPLICIMYKLKK